MMRILSAVFCFLIVFARILQGEEFSTLDGEHYAGATLKRVEPDGVVIAYSDGIKKLRFQKLPPEVCAKYGYNPETEARYIAQRQSNEAVAYQATSTTQASPNHSLNNLPISTPHLCTPTPQVEEKLINQSFLQRIWTAITSFFKRLFSPTPTPSPASPASPSPTPPPTPEQIVQAVLNKPVIQAEELGMICTQFPSICNNLMNGRILKINGDVRSISISGIDHEKAEVTLSQTNQRRVIIIFDLNRYDPLLQGRKDYQESWMLIGPELFYQRIKCEVGQQSQSYTALICTIGKPLSSDRPIRLYKGTASSIYFEALGH